MSKIISCRDNIVNNRRVFSIEDVVRVKACRPTHIKGLHNVWPTQDSVYLINREFPQQEIHQRVFYSLELLIGTQQTRTGAAE